MPKTHKVTVEFAETDNGEWQADITFWLPMDEASGHLSPDYIDPLTKVAGTGLYDEWGWTGGVNYRYNQTEVICANRSDCEIQALQLISRTGMEIEKVVARNQEVFGVDAPRFHQDTVTLPSGDRYKSEVIYYCTALRLVYAEIRLLLPTQGIGRCLMLSKRFQHPTIELFDCPLVEAWGSCFYQKEWEQEVVYLYRVKILKSDTLDGLKLKVQKVLDDVRETIVGVQQTLQLFSDVKAEEADDNRNAEELNYAISVKNWEITLDLREISAIMYVYLPIDPATGSIHSALYCDQVVLSETLSSGWGFEIIDVDAHPEGFLGKYRYRNQVFSAITLSELEERIEEAKAEVRKTLDTLIDQVLLNTEITLPSDSVECYPLPFKCV
jgi:hypothetical protein